MKDKYFVEHGVQTRVREMRILLYTIRYCLDFGVELKNSPDFLLRYNDEKVANDPTNMPKYAKGTTSPIQFTIVCDLKRDLLNQMILAVMRRE